MNKYSERINKLRPLIKEAGIDALFINDTANVAYFTGKKGDDCYLYISQDEAYVITDFRYLEMAESMSDWLTLDLTKMGRTVLDILKDKKDARIGVEKDAMTLNMFMILNTGLKDLKTLVPVSGIVEKLRMIKDEDEIESTRKACDIAKRTYLHMLDVLKPGMEEVEAAAELEYFMRKCGAEGPSFDTILISGIKTSMPHGVPGHKKIEYGDFVTMDFGCKVDGYCSDITRTVAIGSVTDEMRKVYDIVLKAQLNAIANIHAGITGQEGDSFARSIIEEAGYGEYFGHSLGHGTGLYIHEAPNYSQSYKEKIPAGAILSIEPGIYLPSKFGVRIEDLALVTESGIIDFEDAPKDLTIL
jgi:Xaa-Pro aminopeptidase